MTPHGPLAERGERLARLSGGAVDVAVVGGGITGAGIAHDLALRGLSVALLERDDWAAATSSASSRLVHGGLRYLEQFELSLVRESCLERALLLRNASGYVWPESFVFPVRRGDRVGLGRMLAGLWLYTALSFPRALGWPGFLSARRVVDRVPGIQSDGLRGGGSYLDGSTDDARLTLAIVKSAALAGAAPLSRCEVRSIERGANGVELGFADRLAESATEHTLRADAVVLAGGPFTESLRNTAGLGGSWIAPTRGSHIVVARDRLPTAGAVILPSAVDGRVMFFIPWARHTIIGTTDLDAGTDGPIRATGLEVDYLLDSANALVPAAELTRADVLSSWAGLRPLLAATSTSPSERSREERVERDGAIFTIAGGKLTGYRAMAEKLAPRIVEALGRGERTRRSRTRSTPLVGSLGALPTPLARPEWSAQPTAAPVEVARRHAWRKRYGTAAQEVEGVCTETGGGEVLDAETLLGEVDWAVRHEDCLTPVDFFFRRTDLAHDPAGRTPAVQGQVLARMAGLLGWESDLQERRADELRAALGQAEAWRAEG